MIKRVLVLEDSPERVEWLQNNANNVDFYFCKDVSVAKGLLKLQKFDAMYLDHDLGGDKPTGYDFAKILAKEILEGRITNKPNICIHTSNPIGAENMKSVLPQAVIRPFYELIKKGLRYVN